MNITIVGYGKIGKAIAEMWLIETDHNISIIDKKINDKVHPKITAHIDLDVLQDDLTPHLKNTDILICTTPFFLNKKIAYLAKKLNIHYFDITEDRETTEYIKELAKDAQSAFVPQCGLAPGFISIVANSLIKQFDTVDTVKLRVGALPVYPNNKLSYNLTWSTDGVINEYGNPCQALINGKLKDIQALENLENFSNDGVRYEAFNTSGGLGTLAETYAKKIKNMNYKSIRYPGHCDYIKLLMNDLGLKFKRELFREILDDSIPFTRQDVVIIIVNAKGYIQERLEELSLLYKVYHENINGRVWSAIEKTTAAGLNTVIDLFIQKKLPQKGFILQELVDYEDFKKSVFSKYILNEKILNKKKHF